MRTRFVTFGRMIVASICGIIQFMLVIGGMMYWQKFARDCYPDVEFLRGNWGGIAAMLGLLSLLWPMYVFGVAKATFDKNTTKQK
jgi:hypothetical protein